MGEELQGCKRAIDHQREVSIWQPAPQLQTLLSSPVEQGFGWSLAVLIKALRWRQAGEQRQSPDPLCPGNPYQQHEAEPPEARGFDKMASGRPHRITINTAGADLCSPATLDGVVHSEQQATSRRELLNQERE